MTSLYDQSVPVLIKYLHNFSAILDKAQKFVDEQGLKHEEFLEFRLVSDMRGLDYQVQCCCNTAKFLASRLAGTESVFFEDDEKTFDEFRGRIAKTIEILKAVDPQTFKGKETQEIVMETKRGNFRFIGQRYVSEFALPNFHFHLSTAYCILRNQGVPIDALDYLKDVMPQVEKV